VQTLSAALNRLRLIERWARRTTGAVFIAVGIYYTFDHILELF